MRRTLITIASASCLALAACGGGEGGEAGSEAAEAAAGEQTITDGLGDDVSTFRDAAKAAGLDTTLSGPGPYTVLVPSNSAFEALPAGSLDTLMKEESRPQLIGTLTYHVLPGAILAEDIGKAIDQGEGSVELPTHGEGVLTATREDGKIVLTDGAGTKATVTEADIRRTNGVVHVVDAVLMPN